MADIKIFTKSGCPYCAALRESLNNEGVEFKDIDVHSSPQAEKEALDYSSGKRMVPILVRDNKVTVGFNGG